MKNTNSKDIQQAGRDVKLKTVKKKRSNSAVIAALIGAMVVMQVYTVSKLCWQQDKLEAIRRELAVHDQQAKHISQMVGGGKHEMQEICRQEIDHYLRFANPVGMRN